MDRINRNTKDLNVYGINNVGDNATPMGSYYFGILLAINILSIREIKNTPNQ